MTKEDFIKRWEGDNEISLDECLDFAKENNIIITDPNNAFEVFKACIEAVGGKIEYSLDETENK